MEKLKSLIQQADDDYLIGLCNKGTVKRAYKDLEQETPALTWQEQEAQVTLKEETCVIRAPLGESACTCPSRSVCRHVITAILWLKRELSGEAGENSDTEEVREDKADRAVSETDSKKSPGILNELLQIPADRLKRACKSRGYKQFLSHMRAEELPPVEESSIVTVTLPWEKASVKLLEPFEYSTCSCHSKELGSHKAQAVLAYQIIKGKVTLKELEALQTTDASWDMGLVKRACENVREEITHQMCIGLSRQSQEVSDSLERLAVITHRAGLPALESGLREAAAYYQQYFSRSAAFRNGELFRKLLVLYQKSEKIGKADSQETIQAMAGAFRDAYEPAGRLHLVSMGGRTFSSRTGYEGEIYYFLEARQKKWYTWTDARPVFYEGIRRKPPANSEKALAPWGLSCSREQLQSLEFDLLNAKAASGGRLSASQESKAEVTGTRSMDKEAIRQMTAWDYEALLAEYFGGHVDRTAKRQERLALVGAVRWGETSFDTVQQHFTWSLYDRMGRKLFISLKYTKEERLTINLLERLEQRLRRRSQGSILFFGSVYMDEEGRLCLFPIEFFLKEAEAMAPEPEKEENSDNKISAGNKNPETKLPSAEILNTMKQYCREASRQLSDLFASGINSVQDEMIAQLSELAEDGERLGLHQAGADFACIAGLLRGKRHQIEFSPEPVLKALGRLDAYLLACRERLSYHMALLSMRDMEETKNLSVENGQI